MQRRESFHVNVISIAASTSCSLYNWLNSAWKLRHVERKILNEKREKFHLFLVIFFVLSRAHNFFSLFYLLLQRCFDIWVGKNFSSCFNICDIYKNVWQNGKTLAFLASRALELVKLVETHARAPLGQVEGMQRIFHVRKLNEYQRDNLSSPF